MTANVGISGNAFVGTYLAINNTNPGATDSLVVTGNIRLHGGASQLVLLTDQHKLWVLRRLLFLLEIMGC